MSRWITATVALAVMASTLLAGPTRPAAANHCGGGAWIIGVVGGASYSCHGNEPGAPPTRTSQSGLWATWCAHDGPWQEGATVTVSRVGTLTRDDMIRYNVPINGTYGFYSIYCTFNNGTRGTLHAQVVFTEDPPIDPEVLRNTAAARIQIEPPNVGTSPPFDDPDRFAIVHMDTWLWTTDDWEIRTETEAQGFIQVEVFARPETMTWTFSDGSTVACHGPGIIWQPAMPEGSTYCYHVFTHSSAGEPDTAYTAEATISWVFSWAINGADQGDFGVVTSTTPFSIQVGEIQAISTD